MTFALLESLSLPGNPEKANDDAFGARDRAAVVLDGATGLGEPLLPGPSDAAWLARFGANRILAYIDDGAAAREAVTAALFDAETSFTHLRRRVPKERYEIPYASLMLAQAGADEIEFVWYGDCAALLEQPDGSVAVIGDALAKRARESARVKQLAALKGEASAASSPREAFLPALRAARNSVNTQAGSYLFGPDVAAADHAAGETRAAAPGAHLLLVSDGFLALASDYARYDAASLLGAAKSAGLAELARELRSIEAGDPDGRQFPRFKKSDDATALLLRLG